MKTKAKYITGLSLILLLMSCTLVEASSGGPYEISWYTIDGGGGTSSGGPYQVNGTMGQPDAAYLYEPPYELLGGFWIGGPLCIVNLEDFAKFATYWLDGPCYEGNNWCNGADINKANDVDIVDLTILASYWLDFCPYDWSLK